MLGCEKSSSKVNDKASVKKNVYDENADVELDIQNAITLAGKENKRILLVFGANWCPWCLRLHHLIESDKEINSFIHNHYQLVLIDLGRRDRNMEIDARYGQPNKLGIPAIVVLDKDGTQLYTQETGSLAFPEEHAQKGHDPVKVMLFLKQWAL